MPQFYIGNIGRNILEDTYRINPPRTVDPWNVEKFRSRYKYLHVIGSFYGLCDAWVIEKDKEGTYDKYDLARKGAFPGCKTDRIFGLNKCCVNMYTDPNIFQSEEL